MKFLSRIFYISILGILLICAGCGKSQESIIGRWQLISGGLGNGDSNTPLDPRILEFFEDGTVIVDMLEGSSFPAINGTYKLDGENLNFGEDMVGILLGQNYKYSIDDDGILILTSAGMTLHFEKVK